MTTEAQRKRIMKYRYKIYNQKGENITTVYRMPWKVVINNILRFLQFWTKDKYIITTTVDSIRKNGEIIEEIFKGHTMARVNMKITYRALLNPN